MPVWSWRDLIEQTRHHIPLRINKEQVTSPELVCSFSELPPQRSDWHWCSHYYRSVDKYDCGRLWKEREITQWGSSLMALWNFSCGTDLFQVLFSVPHEGERNLPDKMRITETNKTQRHSFKLFSNKAPCCRLLWNKKRPRQRGNHNSVAL